MECNRARLEPLRCLEGADRFRSIGAAGGCDWQIAFLSTLLVVGFPEIAPHPELFAPPHENRRAGKPRLRPPPPRRTLYYLVFTFAPPCPVFLFTPPRHHSS